MQDGHLESIDLVARWSHDRLSQQMTSIKLELRLEQSQDLLGHRSYQSLGNLVYWRRLFLIHANHPTRTV